MAPPWKSLLLPPAAQELSRKPPGPVDSHISVVKDMSSFETERKIFYLQKKFKICVWPTPSPSLLFFFLFFYLFFFLLFFLFFFPFFFLLIFLFPFPPFFKKFFSTNICLSCPFPIFPDWGLQHSNSFFCLWRFIFLSQSSPNVHVQRTLAFL